MKWSRVQQLQGSCRIGDSGMTVGKLNKMLDDLRDASSKRPGVGGTPSKGTPDKGRKKAPGESMKGRYLRSIVNSVDKDELQLVLNVIVKAESSSGVSCDAFMRHVHQDYKDVMNTYASFLPPPSYVMF